VPTLKRKRRISANVHKDLRGAKDANPIQATRSDEVNRSARRKNSARGSKKLSLEIIIESEKLDRFIMLPFFEDNTVVLSLL
jgi:hypothetical protein